MEDRNVTRLASPAVAIDVTQKEKPPCSGTVVAEETEEEDSFFELEMEAPDSSKNKCSTSNSVENNNVECDRDNEQKASASQGDKLFSKRKILPIEGLHRNQSPISLLKSAPKFRVFAFAQAKSTPAAEKAESGEKQGKNRGNGPSTLKFKTEIQPPSTGSDIKRTSNFSSDASGGPKRFSREVIQKYFRLIKPLYARASKKNDSSETVEGEVPVAAATSSSPLKSAGSGKPPTGLRAKQLVKSRSASAASTCRVDPTARMDDSLVQLQDGIQSAILHCKRSLSSASRDFSTHDENTVDLGRFPLD